MILAQIFKLSSQQSLSRLSAVSPILTVVILSEHKILRLVHNIIKERKNHTFLKEANEYSALQCFSPLGNDLDIKTADNSP